VTVSRQTLDRLSGETGFRPDALEKVIRLGELAADIGRQPILSAALALKGGTALNLCFGAPRRLSVDLDFNYIASADRATMLEERPTIERLVEQIGRGQGYHVQWSADEHAGRKAHLRFFNAFGTADEVQIDLNFLFRMPLGEVSWRELWQPGAGPPTRVRVVSFAEAAAGKLVATLARGLPRDVYDVRRLPSLDPPGWSDQRRFRRLFVAIAGILDRPLTEYGKERLRINDQQVRDQLEPMLTRDERVTAEELRLGAWQVMAPMLDLDEAEREYTRRLQVGDLLPELLFPEDPQLAESLARHPALLWKAQNAREHAKERGSR
jgi:hypothetical protein